MKKLRQAIKKIAKKFPITRKLLSIYGESVKHTRYTKFVVIGNARTGSSFLLEGLSTIPSIKMYDEIFAKHERTYGENYEGIIAATFGKVNKGIKIVGFKLFYNHLTEAELQKFLQMKDIKIIHLIRENKLKTIVSLDRAFKTDQWFLTKEKDKVRKKVGIDGSTLISRMETIINYEKKFQEYFKGRDVLSLSYEKMARDPEKEFNRVSEFLKIPKIDLAKIKLKKQGSSSLSNDVENIDEIISLLKHTEYEKYLS